MPWNREHSCGPAGCFWLRVPVESHALYQLWLRVRERYEDKDKRERYAISDPRWQSYLQAEHPTIWQSAHEAHEVLDILCECSAVHGGESVPKAVAEFLDTLMRTPAAEERDNGG